MKLNKSPLMSILCYELNTWRRSRSSVIKSYLVRSGFFSQQDMPTETKFCISGWVFPELNHILRSANKLSHKSARGEYGKVRTYILCSSSASHLGQLEENLCLCCTIILPVTASSLSHLVINTCIFQWDSFFAMLNHSQAVICDNVYWNLKFIGQVWQESRQRI